MFFVWLFYFRHHQHHQDHHQGKAYQTKVPAGPIWFLLIIISRASQPCSFTFKWHSTKDFFYFQFCDGEISGWKKINSTDNKRTTSDKTLGFNDCRYQNIGNILTSLRSLEVPVKTLFRTFFVKSLVWLS